MQQGIDQLSVALKSHLSFNVEGRLLFSSLLPPEPGIPTSLLEQHKEEKWKRINQDAKDWPYVGQRWTAAAPQTHISHVLLQWTASIAAPRQGKGPG